MKDKFKFLLFLVVFLAGFLRFYQIDTNPKSLYGDSLTLVYDAYSIIKTGHDQKGAFLPIVFSQGGGRPAGYVYATVPFVALFGPTALAVRFVSVLSGISIVLLLYLLGKALFSEGVGLAIAAVAVLNPWELSLSRGPFETHFALFLTLFGFFSFIKGVKKPMWFIFFGLAFALSSQTYPTYRLIVPVFTVWLLIWSKQLNPSTYFKKPLFLVALVLVAASTILSLYLTISRGDQDRFQGINIFKSPELRSELSIKARTDRQLDSLSASISNKIHTPAIELAGVLAENYVRNFLPSFLFLHGDGDPKHNPAGMGEFFWVDAFLIIIGIIYLYKINKQFLILLTGWILISPVATSLVGGAHALRSSFLLVPLLIFSGMGLWKLWNGRARKFTRIILILLLVIFLFQVGLFIDRFYFVAPQKNARFWSYPAKRAAILAAKNRSKFDFVVLSNDIDNMEFAYPLYNKIDPNLVIKQNESRTKVGEYQFFKYGNVYIGSLPHTRVIQFIKNLPGSVLYFGSDKEQAYLENYVLLRGFDGQLDLVVVAKGKDADLIHP